MRWLDRTAESGRRRSWLQCVLVLVGLAVLVAPSVACKRGRYRPHVAVVSYVPDVVSQFDARDGVICGERNDVLACSGIEWSFWKRFRGGLRDFVTGGREVCAIERDRRVRCWRLAPAGLGPLRHNPRVRQATSIVASDWETCALDRRGRVWCWLHEEAEVVQLESAVAELMPVGGGVCGVYKGGKEGACWAWVLPEDSLETGPPVVIPFSDVGDGCWMETALRAVSGNPLFTDLELSQVAARVAQMPRLTVGRREACFMAEDGVVRCVDAEGKTADFSMPEGQRIVEVAIAHNRIYMLSARGHLSCHGEGCDLPGARLVRREHTHLSEENRKRWFDGLPPQHPDLGPSPVGGPGCTSAPAQ